MTAEAQRWDVVSVGNFCVDLLVRPVEALPEPSSLLYIEEYDLQTGGCANNCAIALARLGMGVTTVGRVGRDRTGDIVLQTLAANGVDTSHMVRDAQAATSLSVVVVRGDGERSFIHHRGATDNLARSDVSAALLGSGARALHVGGAFLLTSLDGPPLADLLAEARCRGLCTFVDTAVDGAGNQLEVVEAALPHMDYFLPSEAEARGITGMERPEDMAAYLLERGVGAACIKLGGRGCYVADASGGALVPAYAVEPLDTTGAGDTFTAGFIAATLRGMGLAEAGQVANAVGAMCVTGLGATSALGSWEETRDFMARTAVRSALSEREVT